MNSKYFIKNLLSSISSATLKTILMKNQLKQLKLVMIGTLIICTNFLALAQSGSVGIGTDTPEGALDVVSSTEGILIPRVSLTGTTDVTTIVTRTASEMVYNTATVSDVTPGFYYWNGSQWVRLLVEGEVEEDVDWFEEGTTSAPDAIGDNIYTNGNVGIGSTAPAVALHIERDGGTDGQLIVETESISGGDAKVTIRGARSQSTSANHAEILFQNYDANIDANGTLGSIVGRVSNSTTNFGDLLFNVSPDGSNITEAMRLKSDGNVGIGVPDPSNKLHIGLGAIKLTNSEIANLGTIDEGQLFYDRNFYDAGEVGESDFGQAGNGGGLAVYNPEEGWGALISTANMEFLDMDLNSLNVGYATSNNPGTNNVIIEGTVGIGDTNPGAELNVVGRVRTSNTAAESNYIEMRHGGVNAFINYEGAGNLDFRNSDVTDFTMEADGDLLMQNDNMVKMPNNIFYDLEDDVQSVSSNDGSYKIFATAGKSGSLGLIRLETGNLVKVTVNGTIKTNGGIFGADSNVELKANLIEAASSSTSCADDIELKVLNFNIEDTGNRQVWNYVDVYEVTCTTSSTYYVDFSLLYEKLNPYTVKDITLVVEVF